MFGRNIYVPTKHEICTILWFFLTNLKIFLSHDCARKSCDLNNHKIGFHVFSNVFTKNKKKIIFTILLLLLLYYWYIVITVKFLIHFYYYFIIISLLFQFTISIIYLHYSLSLKFSHFFLLQEQWELQWLPFFLQLQLPLLQFMR